jgi:acyl carrier protein
MDNRDSDAVRETDRELLELLNVVRRNKELPALGMVTGDPHLRNDLHFDSLDLAEFTVRIEERFGVDVFEDGVVHLWSEIREKVRSTQLNSEEGNASDGVS